MTTPRTRPSPTRTARTAPALLAAALLALLLGGCAGAGDGGEAASTDEAGAGSSVEAGQDTAGGGVEPPGAPESLASFEAQDAQAARAGGAGRAEPAVAAVRTRAVVSTASVSLEADDVADARFDVRRVVDEAGGEVADAQTETDREGEVRRARFVVRVPVASFDEVLAGLDGLDSATVRSSQQASEDVTTQVIDVEARLRAQEASLQRVELLLGRAEDLRDVVAIEAQLTRRQAELDSLRQQQAFLADQTSLATVTVHLERTPTEERPGDGDDGFLAGLAAGWDALAASTTTLLTAAGAVLPFLLVLALLGAPLWWLARRLGRAAGRLSGGSAARTP